ncbi:MAG TPA: transglutaminase-like domain-containing protein [Solirubrobacteraceae bacterium]
MKAPSFSDLAASPAPPLDRLALAIAAELRPDVDVAGALAALDALGEELRGDLGAAAAAPQDQLAAVVDLLARRHGFHGAEKDYDHPDRSMLDLVLEQRVGLPILLSVVYAEVGRRAGVPLAGVGLHGHFVVGHFGGAQPVLADPFHGGRPVPAVLSAKLARPWTPHEVARRMLNNLVGSYFTRMDLGRAIRAAELRLAVAGGDREALELELRGMRARLN